MLESCASHLVRPSPARYRCQECHTWGVGRGVLQGCPCVLCASSCSANLHHRNGFQVPEGHDMVGCIRQYSTLASRTLLLIDDSRGRQATGSSAIHTMVGYRGSTSTFV